MNKKLSDNHRKAILKRIMAIAKSEGTYIPIADAPIVVSHQFIGKMIPKKITALAAFANINNLTYPIMDKIIQNLKSIEGYDDKAAKKLKEKMTYIDKQTQDPDSETKYYNYNALQDAVTTTKGKKLKNQDLGLKAIAGKYLKDRKKLLEIES